MSKRLREMLDNAEIPADEDRERDEVVKRMIATPPQPKPKPERREKKPKA